MCKAGEPAKGADYKNPGSLTELEHVLKVKHICKVQESST